MSDPASSAMPGAISGADSVPTEVTRLYLICLGYRTSETPTGARESNYAAYLVQTRDGRNILIDTGFPEGAQPRDESDQPYPGVVQQLATIGIQPDEIDTLICTHYDLDHAGSNDKFLAAEHVVQRRQYSEAAAGYERYQRSRPYWGAQGIRYRFVEGDTELLPGLRLIDTTGHAPGHQSVLVELPRNGKVLLTIDAIPRMSVNVRQRSDFAIDEDKDDALASTRKLIDLEENEQVEAVIFGHDGPQWRKLRVLPEYYE